jgi:hypothetical protein
LEDEVAGSTSMNWGMREAYMIAALGLRRLVNNPMVNSVRGESTAFTGAGANTDAPLGRRACHASHRR